MKLRSSANLKRGISKTKLTIESFISCLEAATALEEVFISEDQNVFKKDKIGKLIKKHTDHAKKSKEDLYEMGFIKLFADFESFMYEFLVEQYSKHLNAMDNVKIDLEIVLNSKSIKELRKTLADETAVVDSWTIEIWEKKLKEKFNISIFDYQKDRRWFFILNEIRNSILHSGGKASTKTLKKLKSLEAPDLKHGKKVPVENSKLFYATHTLITKVLGKFEK